MAKPPKHLRSLRKYINVFAAVDDFQPSDVEVDRLSRPANETPRAVSMKTGNVRTASRAGPTGSVAGSSG
jgi:hypothetical protein